MADFKPECLPILVISARDQNSAKAIISGKNMKGKYSPRNKMIVKIVGIIAL